MSIIELLDPQEKQLLRYRRLQKNDVLFHEKDRCTMIGILISGQIEIISYLENGQPVIYNQLNAGDIFGNNLIFSSDPHYKGDIIALDETLVALIYKDDLLQILQDNRSFLEAYLQIQSDFGKKLNDTIRLLSINTARERLLFYLHANQGVITFTSITRLAETLSLQRETLSRLIHVLIREKVIIKENNIIRLVL